MMNVSQNEGSNDMFVDSRVVSLSEMDNNVLKRYLHEPGTLSFLTKLTEKETSEVLHYLRFVFFHTPRTTAQSSSAMLASEEELEYISEECASKLSVSGVFALYLSLCNELQFSDVEKHQQVEYCPSSSKTVWTAFFLRRLGYIDFNVRKSMNTTELINLEILRSPEPVFSHETLFSGLCSLVLANPHSYHSPLVVSCKHRFLNAALSMGLIPLYTSIWDAFSWDYQAIRSSLDLAMVSKQWSFIHTIVEQSWSFLPLIRNSLQQMIDDNGPWDDLLQYEAACASISPDPETHLSIFSVSCLRATESRLYQSDYSYMLPDSPTQPSTRSPLSDRSVLFILQLAEKCIDVSAPLLSLKLLRHLPRAFWKAQAQLDEFREPELYLAPTNKLFHTFLSKYIQSVTATSTPTTLEVLYFRVLLVYADLAGFDSVIYVPVGVCTDEFLLRSLSETDNPHGTEFRNKAVPSTSVRIWEELRSSVEQKAQELFVKVLFMVVDSSAIPNETKLESFTAHVLNAVEECNWPLFEILRMISLIDLNLPCYESRRSVSDNTAPLWTSNMVNDEEKSDSGESSEFNSNDQISTGCVGYDLYATDVIVALGRSLSYVNETGSPASDLRLKQIITREIEAIISKKLDLILSGSSDPCVDDELRVLELWICRYGSHELLYMLIAVYEHTNTALNLESWTRNCIWNDDHGVIDFVESFQKLQIPVSAIVEIAAVNADKASKLLSYLQSTSYELIASGPVSLSFIQMLNYVNVDSLYLELMRRDLDIHVVEVYETSLPAQPKAGFSNKKAKDADSKTDEDLIQRVNSYTAKYEQPVRSMYETPLKLEAKNENWISQSILGLMAVNKHSLLCELRCETMRKYSVSDPFIPSHLVYINDLGDIELGNETLASLISAYDLDTLIHYETLRRLNKQLKGVTFRESWVKTIKSVEVTAYNKCYDVLEAVLWGFIENNRTGGLEVLMRCRDYQTAYSDDLFGLTCKHGYVEAARFLTTCEFTVVDAQDNFAIREAAAAGHLPIVECLLQHPSVDPSDGGDYAARWAAMHNHPAVLSRLLRDSRVDPANQDGYGRFNWCHFGPKRLGKLLRFNKLAFPPNERNLLEYSAKRGYWEVFEVLLADNRVPVTREVMRFVRSSLVENRMCGAVSPFNMLWRRRSSSRKRIDSKANSENVEIAFHFVETAIIAGLYESLSDMILDGFFWAALGDDTNIGTLIELCMKSIAVASDSSLYVHKDVLSLLIRTGICMDPSYEGLLTLTDLFPSRELRHIAVDTTGYKVTVYGVSDRNPTSWVCSSIDFVIDRLEHSGWFREDTRKVTDVNDQSKWIVVCSSDENPAAYESITKNTVSTKMTAEKRVTWADQVGDALKINDTFPSKALDDGTSRSEMLDDDTSPSKALDDGTSRSEMLDDDTSPSKALDDDTSPSKALGKNSSASHGEAPAQLANKSVLSQLLEEVEEPVGNLGINKKNVGDVDALLKGEDHESLLLSGKQSVESREGCKSGQVRSLNSDKRVSIKTGLLTPLEPELADGDVALERRDVKPEIEVAGEKSVEMFVRTLSDFTKEEYLLKIMTVRDFTTTRGVNDLSSLKAILMRHTTKELKEVMKQIGMKPRSARKPQLIDRLLTEPS